MNKKSRKKIVTIGGGSGSASVLSGFRDRDVDINALVGVFDSGGSSGRLRDAYGIPALGDARQCVHALSLCTGAMRETLSYRFSEGELNGHTCGNIILTAYMLLCRDAQKALDHVGKLYDIAGRVVPVTKNIAQLHARFSDGYQAISQSAMTLYSMREDVRVESFWLEPIPPLNPIVIPIMEEADLIVVSPGDLFGSIIPIFLMPEFVKLFQASSAKKIMVCNPINKLDQTRNFKVMDFVRYLEEFVGVDQFSTVIYNTSPLPNDRFFETIPLNELAVSFGGEMDGRNFIGRELIGYFYEQKKGDTITRSPVRYDGNLLADLILSL